MSDHAAWLTVARDAANAAAEFTRPLWRQTHAVRRKGYRDLVTETDVAVERIITTRLRAAFPAHAITAEEGGAVGECDGDVRDGDVRDGDGRVSWLIDPLDGTTNFSHNNPHYSISIAAIEAGEPVVAVVLAPLAGHCFTAIRGGGADLNGSPIRVSGRTQLAEAVFAVDSPRDPDLRAQMWTRVGVLLQRAHTLRALGSAALNMSYVAAGWIDLYFHMSLEPWDQAAAALLVREAGGVVSTVRGVPWSLTARDALMAASPALAAACHAAWAEVN